MHIKQMLFEGVFPHGKEGWDDGVISGRGAFVRGQLPTGLPGFCTSCEQRHCYYNQASLEKYPSLRRERLPSE